MPLVNDLTLTQSVSNIREHSDVGLRIATDNHYVSIHAFNYSACPMIGAEALSGINTERSQDLSEVHSRARHQDIFFRRIVVSDEAQVGSEDNSTACL